MNKQEWMEIYARHVIDNSDADQQSADDMAETRAEVESDEKGRDADTWTHPHDAALEDMGDWDPSESEP